MKRIFLATICALAILPGSLVASPSQPQDSATPAAKNAAVKKKSARKTHKAHKAPVAPEPVAQPLPAQEMPPVPATLMNSAPVKPSVILEGGKLTIDAPNSTLSDVLSGVRRATGATIEGATPTERVVAKIGPGDPELVISSLLRGTPYDYVILGAPGKPNTVTRVMLTSQTAQSAAAGSAPPPMQSAEGGGMGRPQMLSPRQPDPNMPQDRNPPEENADTSDNSDDQPQQQPQQQPAPPSQPQQQPDANAPKTPEQLFRELQQMSQPKQVPQQQPQEH